MSVKITRFLFDAETLQLALDIVPDASLGLGDRLGFDVTIFPEDEAAVLTSGEAVIGITIGKDKRDTMSAAVPA